MFEDNSYPAAEVISYETVIFAEDKSYMSSTNGSLPSAETDALWQALQDPVDGVIQAAVHTGFDIQHLPESNISNVDSRYHSYGLEVFHQLHCLDRIRKTFHAEHYFPNDTEAELIWHREHCIDHLRQGIMCSGDIAMDRWQYDIETDQNWLKTDVPHVCRNFESLSNWVKKWRFRNRDWLHFKDTGKLDQAAS
ncbi:hypothetical protein OHC33_008859 [Knufia fluminis]|uniref:Tat pathway signal sequence protein n=1 Tax=Knufia fluminis TaxID=191047 RepID=A0AAN8E9X1_9EURO|nr:hypothetical protein OHC33_008859 [Knufia fluminis]